MHRDTISNEHRQLRDALKVAVATWQQAGHTIQQIPIGASAYRIEPFRAKATKATKATKAAPVPVMVPRHVVEAANGKGREAYKQYMAGKEGFPNQAQEQRNGRLAYYRARKATISAYTKSIKQAVATLS